MHKVVNDQTLQNPEARSIRDIFRVCETPMLKLCAKKVNKLYPLTFSAKSSIMGVWQGVPNTRLTNASIISHQKQPSRCVLMKRCSENMRQIYRRTPTPKYDFQ